MTALSTKFRLTLLKVGEYLTENDVQNLAFLCEDIKPARRELLRNARELFVELQGRDFLSERNVGVLSGWLEELTLHDALRPLREYKDNFLQSTTEQQERCIQHEDQVLKYFCITCDSKVCPDCVFNLHVKGPHDVIKLTDVINEVNRRDFDLENKIEALIKQSEIILGHWEEKKDFCSKSREKVRKEIQNDISHIHEKVEKNKQSMLKILEEKEISDLKDLLKEREDIEHLISKLNRIRREKREMSSDNLSKLRKVGKAKAVLTEIAKQQEQQKTMVNRKYFDIIYKKMPYDGKCGILTFCSLIGGVLIEREQLVHVFDERQRGGGVRLICIDTKDPIKEYWRHSVTVDECRAPVVMSRTDSLYNGQLHLILAVRTTVLNVLLHWAGSMYDSVESVSHLTIDDVDEGSWITSVSTSTKEADQERDFIISLSNSSLLRQYHVSGTLLRKIETKDLARLIVDVAYQGNMFAIISRDSDSAILVKANGSVKQIGALRSGSSTGGSMNPVSVIWTGAQWLVLFISDGEVTRWKVVSFKETGELVKVCCEGTSFTDIGVPMSVTRYIYDGIVSFTNNTFKHFKH